MRGYGASPQGGASFSFNKLRGKVFPRARTALRAPPSGTYWKMTPLYPESSVRFFSPHAADFSRLA